MVSRSGWHGPNIETSDSVQSYQFCTGCQYSAVLPITSVLTAISNSKKERATMPLAKAEAFARSMKDQLEVWLVCMVSRSGWHGNQIIDYLFI